MGKVAEQLHDVMSAKSKVDQVLMWIGPRDADEMQRCIDGNPTIIPCAVGPNIQDGTGAEYYRKNKRFMTLEEMHRWQKDQDPEQIKFPCPHCMKPDGTFSFISDTATGLIAHIEAEHPPENVKNCRR